MKELNKSIEDIRQPARLLAIDTSTGVLAIAALEDGRVVGEMHVSAERNHSIRLVPNIQELISELGWTMQQLDGIAAGQGPGSYTGVRIGVTVAKTMTWSLKLPVAGISSLEALAYSGWLFREADGHRSKGEEPIPPELSTRKEWIIPLMDARRGNVYTSAFEMIVKDIGADRAGGHAAGGSNLTGWHRLSADGIQPLQAGVERLIQQFEDLSEADRPECIRFVGDVQGLEEQLVSVGLRDRCEGLQVVVLEQEVRGEAVGLLAYTRWPDVVLDDGHDLIPNYTQLAEAEAKWLANQNLKQGAKTQ